MRAREMLYKALVQAVLLYSRESWVITDSIMKVLEVRQPGMSGWKYGSGHL